MLMVFNAEYEREWLITVYSAVYEDILVSAVVATT